MRRKTMGEETREKNRTKKKIMKPATKSLKEGSLKSFPWAKSENETEKT